MNKTKTEDLIDFNKGEKVKKDKKKAAADQPNLFGEQDELYNTIQEEISIVVADIKACQDSVEKKEDQITILQKRKDRLERAARTAAKMRDKELKEKKKK